MAVRAASRVGVPLLLALAAMFLALLMTPRVPVAAFGQTFKVGAVRPPAALWWSGPGQAELFGEGPVSTVQQFHGFVRPALVWSRFNQSAAASSFIKSSSSGSAPRLDAQIAQAGQAMGSGWERYLARLVLFAAGFGVTLYLVGLGTTVVVRRHDRAPSRRPFRGVVVAAVLSGALTAAFAALTVVSAYHQLRAVSSLADLVGTAELAPVPKAAGPVPGNVQVAVIGDSTAAGEGNPLVPHPTAEDTLCGRSRDSYAQALQAVTRSRVLDLACSGATVERGLLGTQPFRAITVLPQVSRLKAVRPARAVVVSIGANDVGWTDFVRFCAVVPECGNDVTQRLFQSRLDKFKIQYAQLLQQLADLPNHPTVVVNEYYDPLGSSLDCLNPAPTPTPSGSSAPVPGPSAAAPSATSAAPTPPPSGLVANLDTLRSEIAQINAVLAQGAAAFHDVAVHPDFTGHTLCATQPWVQGANASAPLHPTSAGELAIAAADLPYLLGTAPR